MPSLVFEVSIAATFFFFFVLAFALYFLARKISKVCYSFGFFLLHILTLHNNLAQRASSLGLLIVFNLFFLFFIENFKVISIFGIL